MKKSMDEWVKKMYKSSNGFGDNNQENRREIANERRRTNRESALNKRRNIPLYLSPMTPKPMENVPEEPPKKVNNRLEMLKKWKQEKEKKKLEQKKHQKPMFKWSKVEHRDDFNTALNYIKGKKIIKEKSRNETISTIDRPTAIKPVQSSASKSSSKKTAPSNLKNSVTKPSGSGNLLAGTSGVTSKRSQITTLRNASGSVKVTRNTDQIIHESKTSARHLKFSDNTNRALIPEGNSKDLGISIITKKVKTPKRPENSAKLNESKENVTSKMSKRLLNSFPEELEKKSISGDFTQKKTPKKMKTPRKPLGNSENSIVNVDESGTGMNTTYSPERRRSRRNSRIFSEEVVQNQSITDSLTATKSTRKTKTPRKSLEISTVNVHEPEEKVAMNTTYSPARRSSRISNGFSEELVEDIGKNTSLTLPESSRRVKNSKKSLNNSKISTPTTTEENEEMKTSRSSATKRFSRTSKIDVNNVEAGLQENSEESRKSILNTPKTDWKLIENETYETSSKKPSSLRKSLGSKYRRNYVTPNKSEEDLMDESQSTSLDSRKSPRNMSIPKISLNGSGISTPSPSSGGKLLRMKTPRSSARRKSTKNPKVVDDAGLENSKTPRKNIINTPKTDWKLVENSSSAKKTTSLRKSLGIKSVKNYVTPTKSMENLTIASVPRNRSPRNSMGTPSPKINTPSSVTRRKSRIHNAEVNENGYGTPRLEGNILEIESSAKKPRSLRKSLMIKRNSAIPTPEQGDKTMTLVISTKRRSLNNVEQTMELENASPKKSRSHKNSKSQGSDYFTPIKSPSEANHEDVFVTPDKVPDEPIVYVSPFVTTSRGKSQARQEFKMRKSMEAGNVSLGNHDSAKSPRAAAAYFTRILDAEIEKLQEKCNIWDEYKNSGGLSEDACGLIDMTIGQTNLLISKKFKQFRGLIEKCRTNNESEMRIQCEDLHGFWDMIYKQVNDLNKRFANLQEMKDNNWLEEAPKKKTPKKIAKKKRNRVKSAPASSVLKETILAARRKMAKNTNQGDVEICILDEPKNPQLDCSTPGRGILKSQSTKSEKRKTVAFKDVRLKTPKSANRNTPNQPIRRSLRLTLSGTKLNFE